MGEETLLDCSLGPVFSQVTSWIRFLSELEFEHGTEEIKLEIAQLDFEIVPEFVVRVGIILPPIGAFNQDHDAPNWDFVDRPLVSTQIIPATLSEVGAGVLGDVELGALEFRYQVYATQGLADGVVDGERTRIPDGRSEALFAADNNGSPALSGRVALRARDAELGISNHTGIYNTFRLDGEQIASPRWLSITALDARMSLGRVSARGEVAAASIDVPPSLHGPFGTLQFGAHVDTIVRVLEFEALATPFTVQAGGRFDYVDFNVGTLPSTGENAGDEVFRATGSVALRPGEQTVIRLNYFYQWTTDLLRNAPVRAAGLQLGVASYF